MSRNKTGFKKEEQVIEGRKGYLDAKLILNSLTVTIRQVVQVNLQFYKFLKSVILLVENDGKISQVYLITPFSKAK